MTEMRTTKRVRALLTRAHAWGEGDEATLAAVTEVSQGLLELSNTLQNDASFERSKRLAKLMRDDEGKRFLVAMTDQVLRPRQSERSAKLLRACLRISGAPDFFSAFEQTQLKTFRLMPSKIAKFAMPMVRSKVAQELKEVALSTEAQGLSQALEARRQQALVNVNLLGEAITSEPEAQQRAERMAALAGRADVDLISLKVSALCSQINLWAFAETLELIVSRACVVVEAAMARGVRVMLDMEEAAEVELTLAVLERLSSLYPTAKLGVVVQAYLRHSPHILERILALTVERSKEGHPPLRVRLVKGANLAMERVTASVHGFDLPIWGNKFSTDANYRRLLARFETPLRQGQVELGLASHNLFDLALGLYWRERWGVQGNFGFEMLEGIAPALSRAIALLSQSLMLYVPLYDEGDLVSSLAYLIRRLDENTGPDNFLRASFALDMKWKPPQSAPLAFGAGWSEAYEAQLNVEQRSIFERELSSFERAFRARFHPEHLEARLPRLTWPYRPSSGLDVAEQAQLEPTYAALMALEQRLREGPLRIISAGSGRIEKRAEPSHPERVLSEVTLQTPAEVKAALERALTRQATPLAVETRVEGLRAIAQALEKARPELNALLLREGAKTLKEADAEVSEAVDFAAYYAWQLERLVAQCGDSIELSPRGVTLVASPWNFPLAIAGGGCFAALATGCEVLFKPAPETRAIGARLHQLIAEAAPVLAARVEFIACDNETASEALIADARLTEVILTGASATAQRLLTQRPDLHLRAETGGKNALIVMDDADRDLALKMVVQSAFGHSGQKCSAASLLILERPVYEDAAFLMRLRDAVASLKVGPSTDLAARITPLIRPPQGPLKKVLEGLEEGQKWLLTPTLSEENPQLLSPGILLGVHERHAIYREELFGPVLAILCAEDLTHALTLANGTPYGLTAGIMALDKEALTRFKDEMQAGCLYLNRSTTGAIVGRQPFGGWRASAFGEAAKAGGPNYLLSFLQLKARTSTATLPFEPHPRPLEQLWGQDNHLRYRPLHVHLRIIERIPSELMALRSLADKLQVTLSLSSPHRTIVEQLKTECGQHCEHWSLEELTQHLPAPGQAPKPGGIERIRVVGPSEEGLAERCHARAIFCDDSPLTPFERLEALRLLREQSISEDYHRMGNLGARSERELTPIHPSEG